MATMVKEKRKEKKKKKENISSVSEVCEDNQILVATENTLDPLQSFAACSNIDVLSEDTLESYISEKEEIIDIPSPSIEVETKNFITTGTEATAKTTDSNLGIKIPVNIEKSLLLESENKDYLNSAIEDRLVGMEIKSDNKLSKDEEVSEIAQNPLQSLDKSEALATIKCKEKVEVKLYNFLEESTFVNEDSEEVVNALPSAPMLFDSPEVQEVTSTSDTEAFDIKIQSLPLEEVMRIFGEKEIMEVKAISESEEANVEAGADCGPEHPLVDLLHTFRSSINKLNHESIEVSKGIVAEEKFRSELWKVKTKVYQINDKCPCDGKYIFKTNYDEATFLRDKLELGKMKLKSIVTQVQESYCHYLHSALMAHCQIEDLLSVIAQSNKREIRTALSLVLQELRLSEDGSGVVCEALLRWSQALVASLLNNGDLRHLLFLVHHLFRQSRSISWAAKFIHIPVRDICEAAQAIAIIEILLTNVTVYSSKECIEDLTEQWEELDESGASGAVSDRGLRERDVIALLESCSIGDLVATLARMRMQDMKPQEISWSNCLTDREVLRSTCGVRTLLASLHRGLRSHVPRYMHLAKTLVDIGVTAACCVYDLYVHTRPSFTLQMRHLIASEIETVFASTFALWISSRTTLPELPFRMISDLVAVACSMEIQLALHETNPSTLKCLGIELDSHVTCDMRVRIVTNLSTDRRDHTALANSTMEFLFKLAALTKLPNCKDICVGAARSCLSELLSVHPYLYSTGLVMVADRCNENVENVLQYLSPEKWRPTPAEIYLVLNRYSELNPKLIPTLLLALDYTPHSGITLETQICLAHYISSLTPTKSLEVPEWAWSVLRRLNVHLTWWSVGLEAPNPCSDKEGLICDMLALLTTSWGHCLPLICEYGVGCLLRLVSAGRLKEAAHCLAPVMIVLTQSPESIAFTKQFSELFNAFLNTGPTLIQRALGLPGVSGSKILLNLMLQQLCYPEKRMNIPADVMWQVWLFALWDIPAGRELIETCVCATGLIEPLMRFVQDQSGPPPSTSLPPACAYAYMTALSRIQGEEGGVEGRWGLLNALRQQMQWNHAVHVDNALKSVGSKKSSEDLVIHKTAAAILAAPLSHPASLSLWSVFFRLYFETPPVDPHSPPMGPLFFKGIIKSRVLNQLKSKLQETINYHQNEITRIENEHKILLQDKNEAPKTETDNQSINASVSGMFSPLKLADLIGGTHGQSKGEIRPVVNNSAQELNDRHKNEISSLNKCNHYHTLAMARSAEFLSWLDEDSPKAARRMRLRLDYLEPIKDKEILPPIWQAEFKRRAPAASPDDDALTPRLTVASVPSAPITSQLSVDRLKKYKRNYSKQQIFLRPLNQDDVVGDKRKLKKCVEDSLQQILHCCKKWNDELSRVINFDKSLWPLVAKLYEPVPFHPVKLKCSKNCSLKTFVIEVYNWRVSDALERGISTNRDSSMTALRQLARPRPKVALIMARLQSLARQVTDIETARHFVDNIWRYSNLSAPHLNTLSDIANLLSQRFICNDSILCTQLLKRWCAMDATLSSLRQSIAGALLTPKDSSSWHTLYITLLDLPLPLQTAFTFLSKFGASPLSANLSREERKSALKALLDRIETIAMDSHQMLLELLCVHIMQLTTGDTLRFVCTRAAIIKLPNVRDTLSPQIYKAIENCATNVEFDELGHLLRELGTVFWKIRGLLATMPSQSDRKSSQPDRKSSQPDRKSSQTDRKSSQTCPLTGHRPADVAAQTRAIFAAFVSAAYGKQFAVERVAWYAWSALVDSWSPWVSPHESMPLLLPTFDENNLFMLRQFLDSVRDLVNMCAGCESYIFQQLFEWTGQIILANSGPNVPKENSVQVSLLLTDQLELEWHAHEWFDYMTCIHTLLKLVPLAANDACVSSWLVRALRARRVASWLRHTPDECVAPALHQLFYVLTALPLADETLEEATLLPWYRLPPIALQSCLETFYGEKFSVTVPYHDLPCFRIVLYASALKLHQTDNAIDTLNSPWLRASSGEKRAVCVSLWTRALTAPTVITLVADSCAFMLNTLADLAAIVEEKEFVELLVRTLVILYITPSDAAALPSWEQYLSKSSSLVTSLSLQALGALTSLDHFARLADVAVKTLMLTPESAGWSEVLSRLASSHWHEPLPFLERCRPHLAYAVATLHPPPTVPQLHQLPFDFVESEVILSVWICYLCRLRLEQCREATTAISEDADVTLSAWCQDKKTSFLRVITLRGYSDQPTDRHRLLSRYAKLILNPESAQAKNTFEASYTTVIGSNPAEVLSLTNTTSFRQLVQLAIKLYPNHEKYFKYELDMSPK